MMATAALFYALGKTNENRSPEQQGSVNPAVLLMAMSVDIAAYVALVITVFIL